ncbi:hypothetical protein AcV5_009919 [Taiwanofungus camphoratus]|nr:hypothetical protein AcV5_009919 [Antrodia cinnamomea]
MVAVAFLAASLFTLALGKPLARNMRIHERRDSPPAGYALTGAASPDTVLNVRIALAQSNPAGLEEALYDVSTPSSPNYGKHLSKQKAAQFVVPTTETVAAVNTWLQENDLTATTLTPAGDWLSFEIPVSKANDLFDADYNVYTYESTGQQTMRTLSYSIPQDLQSHVKVVYPTVQFPNPQSRLPLFRTPSKRSVTVMNVSSDASSSCASTVTPACLQSLYGIPTTPATQSSNKIGVSGYVDQYANKADLEIFLKKYRTDMSATTTFTVQTLDGGSDPQNGDEAGDEANLDVQYTIGLATDVPVVFISVGESNNDGDLSGFLDIINYLLNEDSPPQVLTTSYGEVESEISISLADNLCNAYSQLGARGVSILFASGDGGVSGSRTTNYCTDFVPTFPSGCPYMTSVGATAGINPETAASYSSGGFSNYWGIPSYQRDAVKKFLSSIGNLNSGLYNASGRGYPDVSAQGTGFEIVVDEELEEVEGTSCASPTFASVIGLINDQLIAAGKSPLGFLNPWLYSTAASAFTDITSGDNPGCNTNGFSAISGWDPVTGLGTPKFAALKSAAGL